MRYYQKVPLFIVFVLLFTLVGHRVDALPSTQANDAGHDILPILFPRSVRHPIQSINDFLRQVAVTYDRMTYRISSSIAHDDLKRVPTEQSSAMTTKDEPHMRFILGRHCGGLLSRYPLQVIMCNRR